MISSDYIAILLILALLAIDDWYWLPLFILRHCHWCHYAIIYFRHWLFSHCRHYFITPFIYWYWHCCHDITFSLFNIIDNSLMPLIDFFLPLLILPYLLVLRADMTLLIETSFIYFRQRFAIIYLLTFSLILIYFFIAIGFFSTLHAIIFIIFISHFLYRHYYADRLFSFFLHFLFSSPLVADITPLIIYFTAERWHFLLRYFLRLRHYWCHRLFIDYFADIDAFIIFISSSFLFISAIILRYCHYAAFPADIFIIAITLFATLPFTPIIYFITWCLFLFI